MTPLHLACIHGHLEVVKVLCDSGADINAMKPDLKTPLALARAFGVDSDKGMHLSCVFELMNRGAGCFVDVFAQLEVQAEQTTLQKHSAEGGKNSEVSSTRNVNRDEQDDDLSSFGTFVDLQNNLDQEDEEGNTALQVGCKQGRVEIVRALVKASASLDITNESGITAVYFACESGSKECLDLLIKAKANVSKCRTDGRTPAYIACRWGQLDCLTALVRAKADLSIKLDVFGWNPLHAACWYGYPDCARFLARQGMDLSLTDIESRSPLHIACFRGQPAVIQALVDSKADVDQLDQDGQSPLFLVRDPECVRVLASAKANLDQQRQDGKTLLHLTQNDFVTKQLLVSGADLSLVDAQGRHAPLSFGERRKFDKITNTTATFCKELLYTVPFVLLSPVYISVLTLCALVLGFGKSTEVFGDFTMQYYELFVGDMRIQYSDMWRKINCAAWGMVLCVLLIMPIGGFVLGFSGELIAASSLGVIVIIMWRLYFQATNCSDFVLSECGQGLLWLHQKESQTDKDKKTENTKTSEQSEQFEAQSDEKLDREKGTDTDKAEIRIAMDETSSEASMEDSSQGIIDHKGATWLTSDNVLFILADAFDMYQLLSLVMLLAEEVIPTEKVTPFEFSFLDMTIFISSSDVLWGQFGVSCFAVFLWLLMAQTLMYALHSGNFRNANKVEGMVTLLSHTLYLTISAQLLNFLSCDYVADSVEYCWTHEHRTMGLSALYALILYQLSASTIGIYFIEDCAKSLDIRVRTTFLVLDRNFKFMALIVQIYFPPLFAAVFFIVVFAILAVECLREPTGVWHCACDPSRYFAESPSFANISFAFELQRNYLLQAPLQSLRKAYPGGCKHAARPITVDFFNYIKGLFYLLMSILSFIVTIVIIVRDATGWSSLLVRVS